MTVTGLISYTRNMQNAIRAQVDVFFSRFPQYEKPKGTILVYASEQPEGIIYLRDGIVRQYAISTSGEELTLNIFKPFAFFPMSWALNNLPNRFYFDAMTPVTYQIAPADEVTRFLEDNSVIALDLLKRVYNGVDGVLSRLEFSMSGNAAMKVIYTLVNTAYRFGEKTEGGFSIPIRLTHKDLATISGTSRETFTRELKKLEDDGLIAVHEGKISLLDLKKLESMIVNR